MAFTYFLLACLETLLNREFFLKYCLASLFQEMNSPNSLSIAPYLYYCTPAVYRPPRFEVLPGSTLLPV